MTSGPGSRPSIILACLLSLTTILSADRGVSPTPAHVAPTVTSISPSGGATGGGATVIITGSGFQQGGDPVLAVNFGATGAVFTVDSDTQITATAPAGAPGTVDVRVGTSSQSAIVPGDRFTYFLRPQVNGITPNSGPATGGTVVTISGSDFTGATDVRFGGNILTTGFTVVNDSTITVTTPAGAGTVVVRVTNPGGTDLFSTASFTFIAAPTVSGISPTHGPATGGTDVTITGTNLTGATAVTIDGVAATAVAVVNATTITAKTPARPAGTVGSVLVTTPGGTNAANALFTYDAVPAIASVFPVSGRELTVTTVTLTGTNFGAAAPTTLSVTYGPTTGAEFTAAAPGWTDATRVTATLNANVAGGTAVKFIVTIDGVPSAVSSATFTALPTPTITGVSPATGAAGTPRLITLTGTNFGSSSSDITSVTYGTAGTGSIALGPAWVSATSLTASIQGDVAANVAVKFIVTIRGVSSAASTDTFTGLALPTVTGISPTFGREAGGTTVVISGTSFTGATSVQFGTAGSVAPTSSTNSTVTVTSPAGVGAGIVDVQVTTPVGQSAVTPAGKFTYKPAPSLTSVSVAPGTAGLANTIALVGSNFGATSSDLISVQIGTTTVSSTYGSATSVTASVPTSLPAGQYAVTITTTGGASTLNNAFALTAPVVLPIVTGISPAFGREAGGTTVVISGSNFAGATAVQFGAAGNSVPTSSTNTTVTVTSPAGVGAGIVDVQVTTPSGQSVVNPAVKFTYKPPPSLTSVSVTPGTAGLANTIALVGSNFGATSSDLLSVQVGTTMLSASNYQYQSATSVTASLPTTLPAGQYDVTITTTGGPSTKVNAFSLSPVQVSVTGISPSSGPVTGGTPVVITGTNFSGVTSVTMGGNAAAITSSTNGTEIRVTTPATTTGAGTVAVTLSGPGGSGTSTFNYIPVVTSIVPSTVTANTPSAITLTGAGFSGGSPTVPIVTYGTTGIESQGLNVQVNSDTSIAVLVGADIGVGTSVKFRVTVGGQSVVSTAVLTGVAAPTPPTITSISPEVGPIAGGTTVTITGTNFTDVRSVSFNGVAATSFTWSNSTPTQMTAVSPAGGASASGPITVTTGINPAVGSPRPFTWCGTPTVTAILPASVVEGDTVTVQGTNFCPQQTVVQLQLGLASLNTTTTFISDTRVSFIAALQSLIGNVTFPVVQGGVRGARVDAAVSGLRVVVLGPGGGSPPSPAAVISITPAPVVTSVTPATGPLAGGTSVTITGSDFTGASAVRFGSVAASTFTVVSDTSIIATSPANAAGVVDIIVVSASGTSTARASDQFTYAVGVPTLGEWFTALLAMLVAGIGSLILRQRSRAESL